MASVRGAVLAAKARSPFSPAIVRAANCGANATHVVLLRESSPPVHRCGIGAVLYAGAWACAPFSPRFALPSSVILHATGGLSPPLLLFFGLEFALWNKSACLDDATLSDGAETLWERLATK